MNPLFAMVSVNDTFSTLSELQHSLSLYVSSLSTKYNAPAVQPKLYTITCIGKRDFACDSLFQAIQRKKDGLWVIKKIKLQHRCPIEIHTIGCESYIFRKVNEVVEVSPVVPRIGKVVREIEKRDVKIGYWSVYNTYLRMKEMLKDEKDENKSLNEEKEAKIENKPSNTKKEDKIENKLLSGEKEDKSENKAEDKSELNESGEGKGNVDNILLRNIPPTVTEAYINEFFMLNKRDVKLEGDDTYFFMQFNELKKRVRNVIELKCIERMDGFAVYAVVYDPHDYPIVYAFVISEERTLKETVKYMLDRINDNYFYFVLEFNKEVFEIFEAYKVPYTVKTRDICKEIYKLEKNRGVIEKVWGICNGVLKRQGVNEERKEKRRKRRKSDIYTERQDDQFNDGDEKENSQNGGLAASQERECSMNSFLNINNEDVFVSAAKEAVFAEAKDDLIEGNLVDAMTYDKIITLIKTLYPFRDEERYIAKNPLFNLQNSCECDLEYISGAVYQLGLLECVSAITGSLKISDEKNNFGMNVRMIIDRNKSMSATFSIKEDESQNKSEEDKENIKEGCIDTQEKEKIYVVVNENKEYTVNLGKCVCSCGRYQNLLIPCSHACAVTKDPYSHTSIIYSKDLFGFEYNLTPVISDLVKPEKGRNLKGPGRPKKRRSRKSEDAKEKNN